MKRGKTILWGVLACVWWGLLYPELCFTENTCQPVAIVDGKEVAVELKDYKDFLTADEDQIIISSKFLEWWENHGKQYIK